MSDPRILAESLKKNDAASRREAARALAALGEAAQPAAVALVDCCGLDDDDLREWSVGALEQLGPPSAEDAAALTLRIGAADELSAYWAVTLLGRLGATAASAVVELSQAVEHSPHASVRQRAAWALGKIGSAAVQASPVLERAAASADPRLARLAKQAIDELNG